MREDVKVCAVVLLLNVLWIAFIVAVGLHLLGD